MAILSFGFWIPFFVCLILILAILHLQNDSPLSSEDRALKRSQFESLGMDEDGDAEVRTANCLKELSKVKDDFTKKVNDIGILNRKLGALQKENADLNNEAKSLKQELRTLKSTYKFSSGYRFEL